MSQDETSDRWIEDVLRFWFEDLDRDRKSVV